MAVVVTTTPAAAVGVFVVVLGAGVGACVRVGVEAEVGVGEGVVMVVAVVVALEVLRAAVSSKGAPNRQSQASGEHPSLASGLHGLPRAAERERPAMDSSLGAFKGKLVWEFSACSLGPERNQSLETWAFKLSGLRR